MKLQKIVNRLQKLHPKEIDLSLDRIQNLCKKLGNPQDKIKAISVVGTNGKNSTINAIFSILKEANLKCNVYTSPHILKINERFIFNNEELSDDELADLFEEVESINDNKPITFFEILTASYFYKAAQYADNINLASVVTSISKDHLDWLPKDEQTIKKIVFEKTSTLLNSNIIVAKQSTEETMDYIKKTIKENLSNKVFFNDDFSYSINENDFFYYEDQFGGLKLSKPNVLGQFQLENVSTAIATLRTLNLSIKDEHIKRGILKINSLARLQEIKTGKLKKLVKNNKLLIDGSHNENGSYALNKYLQSLDCKKHVIIGMMANKEHEKYLSYFKDISSITTIDLKTQPNSISGKKLKDNCKNIPNVQYQPSIEQAINSIDLKEGDLLLITGSLYLAGEFLNLN